MLEPASQHTSRRRPWFLGAGLASGVASAVARGVASAVLLGVAWGVATVCGTLTLAAAPPVAAYREGPPPGFSGGFGEDSCHACHFSADLDDGVGRFTIDGVPERYTPGERYELVVSLARPEMRLAGFQLAARFVEDGAQAGQLATGAAEGDRVRVSTDRGVQYAYQGEAGAEPAEPAATRWTLLWTAPESGGPVAFHAAGNAADGDESASGDHVYTTEVRTLARE